MAVNTLYSKETCYQNNCESIASVSTKSRKRTNTKLKTYDVGMAFSVKYENIQTKIFDEFGLDIDTLPALLMILYCFYGYREDDCKEKLVMVCRDLRTKIEQILDKTQQNLIELKLCKTTQDGCNYFYIPVLMLNNTCIVHYNNITKIEDKIESQIKFRGRPRKITQNAKIKKYENGNPVVSILKIFFMIKRYKNIQKCTEKINANVDYPLDQALERYNKPNFTEGHILNIIPKLLKEIF